MNGILAVSEIKRLLQSFQHVYAIFALQSNNIRVGITGRFQCLGDCVELLSRVHKANGTVASGQRRIQKRPKSKPTLVPDQYGLQRPRLP